MFMIMSAFINLDIFIHDSCRDFIHCGLDSLLIPVKTCFISFTFTNFKPEPDFYSVETLL